MLTNPRTLFATCKAILAAHKSPDAVRLFGKDAASKFAGMLDLRSHLGVDAGAVIASQLRKLVEEAATAIQWWLPLHDPDASSPNPNLTVYADVEYFTAVTVQHLWDETYPESVDSGIDVETASPAWLQLVGVPVSENTEEEEEDEQ